MIDQEPDEAAVSAKRRDLDARILPWIEAVVLFVARHWLAMANVALGLFVGLPLLSPVLASSGNSLLAALGQAIFAVYRGTCHQLPERSFFILGHQMAWCQRDAAIWGMMLLGGLAFSLLRRRLGQLDLRAYAVACLPMLIDGVTQLLGVRESTWELRVVTGSIFGLASVWLVFPILERGMGEVRESLEASASAAGRAQGAWQSGLESGPELHGGGADR